MTKSKTSLSETNQVFEIKHLKLEKLEYGANLLKAIAHPMRIAILNFLNDGKSHNVSEIQNIIELEQSMTSHHLGILKNKGIIASKRVGKNTFYFLKPETINAITNCISTCTI